MQFCTNLVRLQTLTRCGSLVAVGCALLIGLGCGPGGAGNSPTLEARASGEKASTASSTSDDGTGSQTRKETVPAAGKPQSKSASTPIVETLEDKKLKALEEKRSAALPIPDSVTKDLGSHDASERLRALDYWMAQGTKAPLDPLLEALEDNDEEVRTKAAKIAEEKWGIKQELD